MWYLPVPIMIRLDALNVTLEPCQGAVLLVLAVIVGVEDKTSPNQEVDSSKTLTASGSPAP